jgi:hypothetical protein
VNFPITAVGIENCDQVTCILAACFDRAQPEPLFLDRIRWAKHVLAIAVGIGQKGDLGSDNRPFALELLMIDRSEARDLRFDLGLPFLIKPTPLSGRQRLEVSAQRRFRERFWRCFPFSSIRLLFPGASCQSSADLRAVKAHYFETQDLVLFALEIIEDFRWTWSDARRTRDRTVLGIVNVHGLTG